MDVGTRCTSGVFLTGLGRFTKGGRLTRFGYLAVGERGALGDLRLIRVEGTKGARLEEIKLGTERTLLTEGARGAVGASRKPKTETVNRKNPIRYNKKNLLLGNTC